MHACRPLHVRVDELPIRTLDRASHCHRNCHHWHILNLFSDLQLSGRYISSLCKFCTSSAVFLSKHAWSVICLSLVYTETDFGLGGVFPLITTQMYTRLGFAPASSLLGGIGALLTVVPWILVLYGPRIRARSKFASEIMDITS